MYGNSGCSGFDGFGNCVGEAHLVFEEVRGFFHYLGHVLFDGPDFLASEGFSVGHGEAYAYEFTFTSFCSGLLGDVVLFALD